MIEPKKKSDGLWLVLCIALIIALVIVRSLGGWQQILHLFGL